MQSDAASDYMVIARLGCVVCPCSYEWILFASRRFLKSYTKRYNCKERAAHSEFMHVEANVHGGKRWLVLLNVPKFMTMAALWSVGCHGAATMAGGVLDRMTFKRNQKVDRIHRHPYSSTVSRSYQAHGVAHRDCVCDLFAGINRCTPTICHEWLQ